MNTKARIIALLITLVMLASMLPVMTFSASAEETIDPSKAKVGILKANGTYRKYYTELTKAVFDTASADETVQLLGNCIVDQNNTTRGLQITGEDTLDLNGYVLTPKLSTCRLFHVCMNATFTIKDSRPDAVHQYTENGSLYVWDNDTGTGSITLCGGAITGGVTNTNTSDYAAGNGGTFSDDLSLTQALPCLGGYELVYNNVRTNCWSVVSKYETPDLDTTEDSVFIKGI